MVVNPCVIDDEDCLAMRLYVLQQGNRLEQMISRYISLLKTVKNSAILKGTASDSLEAFIGCAELMQNQIGNISKDANAQIFNFQMTVIEADQYSF